MLQAIAGLPDLTVDLGDKFVEEIDADGIGSGDPLFQLEEFGGENLLDTVLDGREKAAGLGDTPEEDNHLGRLVSLTERFQGLPRDEQLLESILGAGLVGVIGFDHQLMAVVPLDLTLDEVGVEFPSDLPVEPLQFVRVKAVLTASHRILSQRRALLFFRKIFVGDESLQAGDLLLDPGQFIVTSADNAKVDPLELEEIGPELGEERLAVSDVGFERGEFLASLRHDIGFEFQMKG